jgi:N-glycosylase/DNA lyase
VPKGSRLRAPLFSLRHTLECGQFFRFTKVEETYVVQTSGRIFSVKQSGETLFYHGVNEEFLVRFFRLDEDLPAVLKAIDRDPMTHRAILGYPGLRLIRQDPWECLISFLCSSAKAIPHIRTIIENLCRSSGKRILLGNYVGYSFPEPLDIDRSLQWESIRAGFRARYLIEASRSIDREGLLKLKNQSYPAARESLMKLPGVGKKVADCVLLYSLNFLEAFPLDTWTLRGLQQVYFQGKRVGEKRLEEFARAHFGSLGGYAQLYLYHFWRHHPFIRQ